MCALTPNHGKCYLLCMNVERMTRENELDVRQTPRALKNFRRQISPRADSQCEKADLGIYPLV
jgi:hypothetical protein